MNERLNEGSGV